MANPISKAISDLHLDRESQGEGNSLSYMFVILKLLEAAEAADPVSPTFPNNPVWETLHRLRPYRDTFAYKALEQLSLTAAHRYPAAGWPKP